MKKMLLMMLLAICTLSISAQSASNKDATIVSDIQYKSNQDAYVNERCKLDIYYSKGQKDCPVVVWYHGGGLTSGSKQLPSQLMSQGYTIVGVNYRLLPTVTIDQCLDDCAAALAWVFKNIEKYNGSSKKIFVSGHSAGGYITAMLGLDKEWLDHYGVDANQIAGLIPFSGMVMGQWVILPIISSFKASIKSWAKSMSFSGASAKACGCDSLEFVHSHTLLQVIHIIT